MTKKTFYFSALLFAALAFTGCSGDKDKDEPKSEPFSDKVEQAAKDVCECVKTHTLQYCEDDFNKEYSAYLYFSSDFIDAVSEKTTRNCDITITPKTK